MVKPPSPPRKKNYETDVAIIGAGPVGIFTVFQAGLLGMKTILIDSLPELGGQLVALYPEKPIYDIPGFPKVLAKDLVQHLTDQMSPMKPEVMLLTRATTLTTDGGNYPLKLMAEYVLAGKVEQITIGCKVIMVAAGAGLFDHKKPPIPNLAQFENTSVFYFVKNPKDFTDKVVVIGGGGDSAVDWAINLAPRARKVIVVHRRDDFRAAPQSVAMMKSLVTSGKIELKIPYQPAGLVPLAGDETRLKAVVLQDFDGATVEVEADIFLPFYGFASSLGPLAAWGFQTTPRGQIVVNPATMETAVPRVYAIGDVASYDSKYKLILQGFADSAVACHHAFARVTGAALHFEHSTTRGLPGAA